MVHAEHGLVYLDRYCEQETQVLDDLRDRGRVAHAVDRDLLDASLRRVFPDADSDEQRAACRRGRRAVPTTVITGGPGTGKTTAVAGLLAVLVEQAEARGETLRIALAAPTGKAAARMQQAVRDSATPVRRGRPGAAGRRDRDDAAPAAAASTRATAPASATTAATGCRTTWSSSTRPRWCR